MSTFNHDSGKKHFELNTISFRTSFFIKWSALLEQLTGSQGGSLGNMMEGEEEVGEAAATDTSVR